MRTIRLAIILLAVTACSSGGDGAPKGGGGTVDIAQLEVCLEHGMDEFLGSLRSFELLLPVAASPGSAAALGVTWTEISATVYEFTIPADLDGDGTPDGNFDGTATFQSSPAGGISLGERVTLAWELLGHASLTGDAQIEINLTPTHIELSGEMSFTDPASGCTFTLTADELSPLEIEVPGIWPPAPAQQASPIPTINGTVSVRVASGASQLNTGATFAAGVLNFSGSTATVAGATTQISLSPVQLGPVVQAACPTGVYSISDWVGTWPIAILTSTTNDARDIAGSLAILEISAVDATTIRVDERTAAGPTRSFQTQLSANRQSANFVAPAAVQVNGAAQEEAGVLLITCSATEGFVIRQNNARLRNVGGGAGNGSTSWRGFKQVQLGAPAGPSAWTGLSWTVDYTCVRANSNIVVSGTEEVEVIAVNGNDITLRFDDLEFETQIDSVLTLDGITAGLGAYETPIPADSIREVGYLGAARNASNEIVLRKVGYFESTVGSIPPSLCFANGNPLP